MGVENNVGQSTERSHIALGLDSARNIIDGSWVGSLELPEGFYSSQNHPHGVSFALQLRPWLENLRWSEENTPETFKMGRSKQLEISAVDRDMYQDLDEEGLRELSDSEMFPILLTTEAKLKRVIQEIKGQSLPYAAVLGSAKRHLREIQKAQEELFYIDKREAAKVSFRDILYIKYPSAGIPHGRKLATGLTIGSLILAACASNVDVQTPVVNNTDSNTSEVGNVGATNVGEPVDSSTETSDSGDATATVVPETPVPSDWVEPASPPTNPPIIESIDLNAGGEYDDYPADIISFIAEQEARMVWVWAKQHGDSFSADTQPEFEEVARAYAKDHGLDPKSDWNEKPGDESQVFTLLLQTKPGGSMVMNWYGTTEGALSARSDIPSTKESTLLEIPIPDGAIGVTPEDNGDHMYAMPYDADGTIMGWFNTTLDASSGATHEGGWVLKESGVQYGYVGFDFAVAQIREMFGEGYAPPVDVSRILDRDGNPIPFGFGREENGYSSEYSTQEIFGIYTGEMISWKFSDSDTEGNVAPVILIPTVDGEYSSGDLLTPVLLKRSDRLGVAIYGRNTLPSSIDESREPLYALYSLSGVDMIRFLTEFPELVNSQVGFNLKKYHTGTDDWMQHFNEYLSVVLGGIDNSSNDGEIVASDEADGYLLQGITFYEDVLTDEMKVFLEEYNVNK